MLHRIEIVPSARRTVRRGMRLGCALTSHRAGPRRETVLDLSARGARVRTDLPLTRGERVLVELAPPTLGRRVETLAKVAHVVPAGRAHDVGLEFVGLDARVAEDLTRSLRGVPPPLPSARPQIELVWVEMLVTWEEDLGDRVNTFEVSETMACVADEELAIATLGPLLTAGAAPYRWMA